MSIVKAIFRLSLITLLALPVQAVYAESQAPFCYTDTECDEGYLCDGFSCISKALVCTQSDTCPEGQVCNIANSACPECSDEDTPCIERCKVPNGYCEDVPTELCQADAECDENKLCAIDFAPLCADGDAACEQAPKLGCVSYLRFCGPTEDYFECSASEKCNADGRCVANDTGDHIALSETVVIDKEKATRLREKWIAEITSEGSSSSCQATPMTSGMSVPLTGMTLLALVFSLSLVVCRRQHAD